MNLSAQDIMEIMERAKKLGVITLKLEGVEVGWQISEPEKQSEEEKATPASINHHSEVFKTRKTSTRNSSKAQTHCKKCSTELRQGQYGMYCHECYLRRKEERFQQNRGGY